MPRISLMVEAAPGTRPAAMSHTEPLAPIKSSTTGGHKRLAATISYL